MDAMAQSPVPASDAQPLADAGRVPPVEVCPPRRQTLAVVLASPHSGDAYPEDFVANSRLDRLTLRRSEDAYVHDLFGGGPRLGAPLLRATFPRAYVDVNREPYELDPTMFDGPLPRHANTRSPRVAAGLGTIARMVANGADIYRHKLPVAEVDKRIENYYRPYHQALRALVEETRRHFGYCILIDCHSMPSGTTGNGHAEPPGGGADFVLGDCHGASCAPAVTETVRTLLADLGYRVVRNAPYAGGYTTRHYGQPKEGVHALQIEINRRLYMDEATYARRPGFETLKTVMDRVVTALGTLPSVHFQIR